MFSQKIKFIALGIIFITLSGCIGLGSLNYKQVKMLKKQGFVMTDEGWSLGLPERLLFDFDAPDISTENKVSLTRLATQLHKFDLNKVKIIGHTDNLGSADYNIALSEKRAKSVAQVFLTNNFKAENIQLIGKGASQPINNAKTEAARAENRRVTVIIIP